MSDTLTRQKIEQDRAKRLGLESPWVQRLRQMCQAYLAIRSTPSTERNILMRDLGEMVRSHGSVFECDGYLFRWSTSERSLVIMRSVKQSSCGLNGHRTE